MVGRVPERNPAYGRLPSNARDHRITIKIRGHGKQNETTDMTQRFLGLDDHTNKEIRNGSLEIYSQELVQF